MESNHNLRIQSPAGYHYPTVQYAAKSGFGPKSLASEASVLPLHYFAISRRQGNRTPNIRAQVVSDTTSPVSVGWLTGVAPARLPSQGSVLLLNYSQHIVPSTGLEPVKPDF